MTAAQADGRIAGVLLEDGETEQCFSLGGFDVVARNARALLGQMLLTPALVPAPAAAAAQRDRGRGGRSGPR